VIVCDTGPLVAAALANDDHHHACVELFTGLHLARRPLLVPATVVAEVGYLLGREAGPKVESLFLDSLAAGDFTLVDLTAADFARSAELVRRYGDLPSGLPTLRSWPPPNDSASPKSPRWIVVTSP
jgi:uncharacterized protein